MFLTREASCDLFTTFWFSSCCCFVASLVTQKAALHHIHHVDRDGDAEVITQDKSAVFTPLLCNNQDRTQRGTKGNDGLYTAQSLGLCIRAIAKEPHPSRRSETNRVWAVEASGVCF